VRRDDEGFTLIELLMSISISTIILGSITTSLIVFLKTGAETSRRDDHSAGAGLLANYLDRDLASAEQALFAETTPQCSGVTGTVTLVLRWSEFTASVLAPTPTAGRSFESVYTTSPDPEAGLPGTGTRTQLQRFACEVGVGSTERVTVLSNLNGAVDVSASGVGTCSPGVSRLRFDLGAYFADSTFPYVYTGCVKARLG